MSLAIESIIDIMDYEGEEELELILSEFISQKNDEIVTFLKDKAIEFAKKKLSITYLVTDCIWPPSTADEAVFHGQCGPCYAAEGR